MKVGLMGFGLTGKAVAEVLLRSDDVRLEWILRESTELERLNAGDILGVSTDEPACIYSRQNVSIVELLDAAPVDVIVDFSNATAINHYGEEAAKRGIAIISAISRYPLDVLEHLSRLATKTRVIHSPNITIGVNFLLIASKILRAIAPNTDVAVIEHHFATKKDISGTAKILAQNLGVEEEDIKSIRAGGIVGVHEVLFGFPHQTIHLKHESISRDAFGNGILFALKNLPRRAAGLFTMEDVLLPFFHRQIKGRQQERIIKSKQVVPWRKNDFERLQFAHQRHISDL